MMPQQEKQFLYSLWGQHTHSFISDHVQSEEFIYTQSMNQAKVLKRCKELNLEGSCIWALEIMYLHKAEKKV